jgi:hypothetical protein
MRTSLGVITELTTCDLCGEPLTIPPGLIYRGVKGHKQEIKELMKRDFSNEVTSSVVAQVETTLQEVLDVPE